jgi:hypothetical protein
MHITAALLVALLLPFTLASPTVEQVLTPGGYRPTTNVHEVPAGGTLMHAGSEIHVLAANGTVVHVASALTTPNTNTKTARTDSTFASGWIAYAWWLNPGLTPISSFKTTWAVPAVPATDHGQTLFYFNALQPNASSAILQPVLQVCNSPSLRP